MYTIISRFAKERLRSHSAISAHARIKVDEAFKEIRALCRTVFEHEYPRKVWTEAVDFVSLLGTDDAIFILLPRVTSDGNSYQHIAKLTIQIKSPKTLEGLKWAKSSFLSLGNFDVTKLEAYDKTTDTV
ncbi:hypothetical protein ANCCEY_09050 [Ancylostoma ceylanicum]|nr:hypothetical protein ANCCEY_09050 [Ancylostoma ceylanicum]